MKSPLDDLVVNYLHRVEQALTDLPEDRREELLSDLSDHIDAERAALDPPTEAAIRAILTRLGDPATLAAEARLQQDIPPVAVGTAGKRRPGPLGWTQIALGLTLLVCLGVVLVGFVVSSADTGSGGPMPVPTAPTHR
jgi:uncharacterized membrane protein